MCVISVALLLILKLLEGHTSERQIAAVCLRNGLLISHHLIISDHKDIKHIFISFSVTYFADIITTNVHPE